MRKLEPFYEGYSVSHGTLVPEQITEAIFDFIDNKGLDADLKTELEDIKHEMSFYIDFETFYRYETLMNADEADNNFSSLVFEDLFDFMNNLAPDGTSFRAHIGDGSDFGYWAWDDDEINFEDMDWWNLLYTSNNHTEAN